MPRSLKTDQMDVDTVVPTASAPSTVLSALVTLHDSSEQEVALATKDKTFGFLADHFLRQLTAGDLANGNGVSKGSERERSNFYISHPLIFNLCLFIEAPSSTKTRVQINGKANGVSAHYSDNSEMESEAEKVTTVTNGKISASTRTPKKGTAEERPRAGATPKSAGKKRKQ